MQTIGYQVDGAPKGQEGLDFLQKNKYDLLLLDLMLPDTNGVEILKKIRQNPQIKDLRVVIITNLGQESVLEECKKLGAIGSIIKVSYNPDEVITKIKSYLENSPQA